MSNLTIKYKTERARITKVALKYKYSARVSITQQSNKNTACFITNVTMKYRYSVQFSLTLQSNTNTACFIANVVIIKCYLISKITIKYETERVLITVVTM